MCSTRKMAAGRSFGKLETIRVTAAGPPVEAAIATTGNFPLPCDGDAAFRIGLGEKDMGADGVGIFERVAVRTTRTFEASLSFRLSSSPTDFISRSMPLEGL